MVPLEPFNIVGTRLKSLSRQLAWLTWQWPPEKRMRYMASSSRMHIRQQTATSWTKAGWSSQIQFICHQQNARPFFLFGAVWEPPPWATLHVVLTYSLNAWGGMIRQGTTSLIRSPFALRSLERCQTMIALSELAFLQEAFYLRKIFSCLELRWVLG